MTDESEKASMPSISPLTSSVQEKKRKSVFKKKKRKRSKADIQDDEEEERLTAMLFGPGDVVAQKRQVGHGDDFSLDVGINEEKSKPLFELDRDGGGSGDDVGHDRDGPGQDELGDHHEDGIDQPFNMERSHKAAAWVDEDDEGVTVNVMETKQLRKLRHHRTEDVSDMKGTELHQRLRKRFETTTMTLARTDWASLESNSRHKEEEEEEVSSATPLLAARKDRLPPQILQVVRCPDANLKDPNDAVVRAVHFHPGSDPDKPLLLTAGMDRTLRFFHVSEEESEKVHGIHFPKLPIYTASFLGESGQVAVSGRRRFFYIYDAIAGKLEFVPKIMGRGERSLERFAASPDGRTIAFVGNDGYIILVDVKSRQWIADLKMSGSVRAVTFTPDSEQVLSSGSDGDVYRWDLRTHRCVERFANEDGTITSTLSASRKHVAVGAESGVVNLYPDTKSEEDRVPLKSIMHLQTSADNTCFNHDGQILALSTQRERHGLKLLHVPSATIFSNWPTSKTPLNYVWSMDFSPSSRFLAIGNDKGKCLLYKLPHYH
eukprot:CAMPEP_0116866336 /NCGR_PEP_ID=MMETSP0418-20121206/25965_1 /TAXON_ID=1158023 /ORGANISM="Astrosyne radiata, Strain 13vi08-1A" /LENGTH=545 /DNA_ID=CAMNT_0004501945 /DNA_START=80 /DNA_END=1718 /DNA_ORIENTATION=-